MRKKQFIINASITSFTSVLMNIVGISFNVYISNKVGAAGVGLFQLIMSIYGFSVTLATSGINLAATRLIANEIATTQKNASSYIMKRCLMYAAAFGLFSFILLFSFSDFIAVSWLGDTRTKMSLKALSISMPFISMSSAMSGYFMATRRIYKSASAQIFEQIIKISISIISLDIFLKKGIEYACLCMVLCGSIAEITSFIYLYILYLAEKRKNKRKSKRKNIFREICKISLPVALSAYLRSALVTIEHILIPKQLKRHGFSSESALKCYGAIHGMALSVMMFPSAVLKSLSGLLVPELSECAVLGHKRQINHIVSKMIKITLLFSICISGIFFTFANDIGNIIYKNIEVGLYIRLLSPLAVIIYVDGIVDGMLKGLNQQVNSMWYNIIDSIVSIIAIILFIPKYGASGYITVIYISELLNGFLSINRLIKITDFKVKFLSWILMPSVYIYGIGMFTNKMFTIDIFSSCDVLNLILKVVFSILIYVILLFIFSHNSKNNL